jgi:hypothetical protein
MSTVSIQQLFGDGFNQAEAGGGGIYFKAPGLYLCSISKVKVDRAQAGFPYFLMEFDCLESSHPDIRPGMRVAWMATLKNDTFKATFWSNVKQAVLAAVQNQQPSATGAQITDAVIASVCSEQQPLTGIRLRAQASDIRTRAGQPFTKVVFSPVPQE